MCPLRISGKKMKTKDAVTELSQPQLPRRSQFNWISCVFFLPSARVLGWPGKSSKIVTTLRWPLQSLTAAIRFKRTPTFSFSLFRQWKNDARKRASHPHNSLVLLELLFRCLHPSQARNDILIIYVAQKSIFFKMVDTCNSVWISMVLSRFWWLTHVENNICVISKKKISVNGLFRA